jgi:hypothetical protein
VSHPTLTGVVFDTAAVAGFARRDPYPQAICWTLAEHGGSVVIPAAVLAAAHADIDTRNLEVLDVLLGHPGTLVPALDQVAAGRLGAILRPRREIGRRPDELISAAQTVTEATARHWYVLTDRAELLTGLAPELLFDSLP